MSIVIAIQEWPSRSWTILGWMFEASIWLAWLCQSPCRVTRLQELRNRMREAAGLER